jgi:hypothetical protein
MPTLADVPPVPPFRRHRHQGSEEEFFTVDITAALRILFRVANKTIPRKDDGGIDLAKVTEIEIAAVDYDPH